MELGSPEAQLANLGMKRTMARVYVSLLLNGPSSAGEVAKASGVHRVDIYKRLEEMTEAGLCNLKLGRPRKYAAADPGIVVDTLLRNRTLEVKEMTAGRASLVVKLKEFERGSRSIQSEEGASYELITGRRQIYSATRKILRLASNEVMRVISANGIRRSFRHKLLEEYAACAKRGVRVKIITDVSRISKKLVDYCTSNFELRHSSESAMKILIVDSRLAMISGVLDDSNLSLDSPAARSLLSRDRNLAAMLSLIFRHLWESAEPLKD
jgi:sugar-specific transcriptional regulator TrmB